jgi:hypothetical protein
VITGQARVTTSDSVRTSQGPLYAHTDSHVVNTYNMLGMLKTSDAESETYSADDLLTVSTVHSVYGYDANEKRTSGTITNNSQRYDYDPLGGADLSLAVESVDGVTVETYEQIGGHTRRSSSDNTTRSSTLDSSYSTQHMLNTWQFDAQTGEVTSATGVGTGLSHSGNDNADADGRQLSADDASWWDTTTSDITQTYTIVPIILGPAGHQRQINIAKLGATDTLSVTLGRDGSYNQQTMNVVNTYVVQGLRILLDSTVGDGEILESHSGGDDRPADIAANNTNDVNEQNWWDTTVGTLHQDYRVFFGAISKLATSTSDSITIGREGSFSETSAVTTNAYTRYGQLVLFDDESGTRTEGTSVQTSHSGSDTNFLADVVSDSAGRVIPVDWKRLSADQRAQD